VPRLEEAGRANRPRRRCTTSDGWVLLSEDNLEVGHRYVDIMCQMNRPSYATNHPEKIVRRMARFPCEYFYFLGDGFEVVCGLKWFRRSRLYRLMSVGFVGAITPAEALELVVERGRHFFREKFIDRIAAVEPAVMENPAILEFYRLMRRHPCLAVRGHRIGGGTYLWIRVPI
jgi:hypothetical protein